MYMSGQSSERKQMQRLHWIARFRGGWSIYSQNLLGRVGLALLALGQPGAKDDFQAALDYNPLFTPAAEALNQLETNPAPAQAP